MKTLYAILILSGIICHSALGQDIEQILDRPYSFIIPDGEATRVQQHKDTLVFLHSNVYDNQMASNLAILDWDVQQQYKIIQTRQKEGLWVALECLDSVPLSSEPLPAKRFSIVRLERHDQKLVWLDWVVGLLQHEVDSVLGGVVGNQDEYFCLTYFDDLYWKELISLKPVASVDDAKEMIEALEGDQVKLWIEQYKNNPTKEMYGTGVMTEILNRLCIQLGYNPLRAAKALQAFTMDER